VRNGSIGLNLSACTPFFISRGIVPVTPNILGCTDGFEGRSATPGIDLGPERQVDG
jgi:hypothetical protein